MHLFKQNKNKNKKEASGMEIQLYSPCMLVYKAMVCIS